MSNVFIKGDKIDICVPVDEDFPVWAGWFNDQKITEYLAQGVFPNTVQDQKEFYMSAKKSSRFITMIKSKEDKLLGVISLSGIDYEKSSCQIALVCPVKSKDAPFAALEAMALVTEHAFKRLGVRRVWAGQAFPGLEKWNQTLEIIGFKTEGFKRGGFVHGWEVSDAVLISILLEDFLKIIKRRNERLWPGDSFVKYMLNAFDGRISSA